MGSICAHQAFFFVVRSLHAGEVRIPLSAAPRDIQGLIERGTLRENPWSALER